MRAPIAHRTVVLFTAVVALATVACAPPPPTPSPIAVSAPFDPEFDLCERSKEAAIERARQLLVERGVTPTLVPSDRVSWLDEKRYARWLRLRDVTIFRAQLPQLRRGHELRIEAIPRTRPVNCVAVKIWEACAPELAPEGEPKQWHYCGDPVSKHVKTLKSALATDAKRK